MPDMDGLQITRQISKQLPSAAIILFTIHDSPKMNFEARRAGVSRVLPKTAAGLPLIKAVEELLADQREAPPREAPEPVPEIVSGPACEPGSELIPELVNAPTTGIAAPPAEPSSEMMQAEASENAPGSGDSDRLEDSSANSAAGAT